MSDPIHEQIQLTFDLYGPGEQTDAALALCSDAECLECSMIVCPRACPFHFHHDGCPSCAEQEHQG